MKVFFDTEFTELSKNAHLISMGLIDQNDEMLYLEIKDTDTTQCNEWVKENVLTNTIRWGGVPVENIVEPRCYKDCTKQEAKDILTEYFSKYDLVELVSDVCHYDMVLLIDIFGTAFDLPKNICPCCYDINQDIAWCNFLTQSEAFNSSREALLEFLEMEVVPMKHNSLYDALVIKSIYEAYNI